MSSFALRQQSLLTRLTALTKFGNSATFTDTISTYDETTGKPTPGTPTVLATTIGGPLGVNPKYVNGDTIKQTDQMIVVEASRLTFTPSLESTKVAIDGRNYTVTAIKPLRANDVYIGYRMVVR